MKKIILILSVLFIISGCTNIKELDFEDIINNVSVLEKKPNTFNMGYKFYIPKGLGVKEMGSNYAILESEKENYYLYIDLISYINRAENNYKINNEALYSGLIKFEEKNGYVEINLKENDKYLIEIMYNYAKIEVMVDEDFLNAALINAINILSSMEYNDAIIDSLLTDDNLDYTEEIFDMFKDVDDNSNILDFATDNDDDIDNDEIIDTDYVN